MTSFCLGFRWRLARVRFTSSISRFSTCVSTDETASLVEADMKTAEQIGIKGTPTLVINGKIVPGVESDYALSQLVSETK